jgi:OTU domain-containing protein 6
MDEDLETLQARHKKEQKALVAQTTSLKKTVTKGEKSKRKEVLAEIQRLEDDLKERHQRELYELQNKPQQTVKTQENVAENEDAVDKDAVDKDGVESDAVQGIQELSLDEPISNGKKKPKVNRQKARMVHSHKVYSDH